MRKVAVGNSFLQGFDMSILHSCQDTPSYVCTGPRAPPPAALI